MENLGYRAVTVNYFDCAGETWQVTGTGDDYVCFVETRKNGQEDTHVSAVVVVNLETGLWSFEEGADLVDQYGPGTEPFLEFFNTYGHPDDDC